MINLSSKNIWQLAKLSRRAKHRKTLKTGKSRFDRYKILPVDFVDESVIHEEMKNRKAAK